MEVPTRRAWRRTGKQTPGTPKVKLITENLAANLPDTSDLIKVHAISLNFRGHNIANGGNPWPRKIKLGRNMIWMICVARCRLWRFIWMNY